MAGTLEDSVVQKVAQKGQAVETGSPKYSGIGRIFGFFGMFQLLGVFAFLLSLYNPAIIVPRIDVIDDRKKDFRAIDMRSRLGEFYVLYRKL